MSYVCLGLRKISNFVVSKVNTMGQNYITTGQAE